jgi:hypothetical protein
MTSGLQNRCSTTELSRQRNSENHYGRFKVSGKQKWVALKTNVFTIDTARSAFIDVRTGQVGFRRGGSNDLLGRVP